MLVDRRRFLTASLGAAAGLCPVARAFAEVATPPVHRLAFYHIPTGEKLDIAYRERGVLINQALPEINLYLREGSLRRRDPSRR